MAKYRCKPIIVEAVQWNPDSLTEQPEPGIPDKFGVIWRYDPKGNVYNGVIETFENDLSILIGDWIITKENGKKEICDPDIFEANYEKIED